MKTLSCADTEKPNRQAKRSVLKKKTSVTVTRVTRPKSFPLIDTEVQQSVRSELSSPLPIGDTINVLLLGESGVGKSTFNNALINYLAFDSFEEAQSDDPTVFMTISFLITTGDNFEEHIIKFVDFDHPGQSVAQQCRPYVFPVRRLNGRKIRIIDTPGFADMRDIDQDDLNIEHILRFISKLTHLNAICFLLKLSPSQLFSLLVSIAEENIVFCFTNVRLTFYSLGDTAPLLKNILRSLPMTNIRFQEGNTFCFDNESFLSLVYLRSGIIFNGTNKIECKKSWLIWVKGPSCLLHYVSTKGPVYHTLDGRPSMKHALLKIDLLLRPMLEAIRNILRNLILCGTDHKNQWITMYSKSLGYLAARCHSCKTEPTQLGPFWVVPHNAHQIQNDYYDCQCFYEEHTPIYHVLEYELDDEQASIEQMDELIDILNQLCDASVQFAYFLQHVARWTKEDPLFIELVRMVREENECNRQLAKDLREIHDELEPNVGKMHSNKKKIELSMIHHSIATIKKFSIIEE